MTNLGLKAERVNADTKNILYYEGDGDEFALTKDKAKAVIVTMSYNLRLDKNPLMLDQPTGSPVQFSFSKNGEIFQFHYSLPSVVDEEATYSLTPSEKITPLLIKRLGFMVAPTGVDSLFDPGLIRKITIEDYSLVYLDDGKGKYIVPTYLLRGFAPIGKERVIMVMLYLPAAGEGWLQ